MFRQGFLRLALCVSVVASTGPQDNFEPQCQSESDFSWPRFHSLDELRASPWASYFMSAYGELPSSFPLCIFDLWALDRAAYDKANITGHPIVPAKEVKEGDLFTGGLTGYMIYHENWKPLPDNTWVEVTHAAFRTELVGFWAWRQRGSGIWYNTGRTKVFPTPADPSKIHAEAIAFLTANCSIKPSTAWPQLESDIFGSCAREKGFDTLQFEPTAGQRPVATFGMTGLTEMVLVNIDGRYNCGVEDASKTPLHAGWKASRPCQCENYEISETCGMMQRAPFPVNIIGSSPRLCNVQEGAFWNRWKACDPSTCKPTSCGPPKPHAAATPVMLKPASVADFTV